MEDADDDSDASDCLIIDFNRIYQTEPDERTDANRRDLNAPDDNETKENIPEKINDQRTVDDNKIPVINYAALMNKEHLENIPFDILNNPCITADDDDDNFVNMSKVIERNERKEYRDTYNDISLIPHDILNETRENSALYACLIENNTSNLAKYLNSSVNNNSIPTTERVVEKTISLNNLRLVDLLVKPTPHMPPAYRKTNCQSGLGMTSKEIESPRIEIAPSTANKVCNGNITAPAQDTISLKANKRVASVIVPISNLGAICRTKESLSGHRLDRSKDNYVPTTHGLDRSKANSIPSAHGLDRCRDNGLPPRTLYGHSYQTPTVNGHQNQEKYLNPDSRRHPNTVAPLTGEYRQNVMINAYSQPQRDIGSHAPIYPCYLGPRCPTNMATAPRTPLPNPQIPVMPSNMCPWLNCSERRAPVNPTQTKVSGVPMSNPHTMMAWNGYGTAYYNNGPMPRDPRGLNPNNSASQQLAAMSRNTYTHTIRTQARPNLANINRNLSINPKPVTQPKRKAAAYRKQTSSKLAKSTKTKAPLRTNDHTQSTHMNMGIKTRLPYINTPAYSLTNNLQAPLRTEVNLLPTGISTNIETAQATMRTPVYRMNNITNTTHVPINSDARMNIHMKSVQANMRTAQNNATDAQFNAEVNLKATTMNMNMESTQVHFRTQNISNATNSLRTHLNSEDNLQTRTLDINMDTYGVDVRNAEFNMNQVTNSLKTTLNTDNNMILDMTMKRTQTSLRPADNTNNLTQITEFPDLSNKNNFQVTLNTESPFESSMETKIESAQADLRTVAHDLSKNTNYLPATQNSAAPLGSSNMDIKIESAETDSTDLAHDLSDNTNNLQATPKIEAALGSSKIAQVDLGLVADLIQNMHYLPATIDAETPLELSKMDINIELAQTDSRILKAHELSGNTNNLQATLKTETHLCSSQEDKSIESTQTDSRNLAHDFSDNTNNLRATPKTEAPLGASKMDMSIESAQVDVAHDLRRNTNNLPATQNAEAPLGSLKMDIKIESAQADPSDQTTDLSDNTNYLQATLKTEAHFCSSQEDMSIESAQTDSRNLAHDFSDNTNNLQATQKTEAPLGASKMDMSQSAQVNVAHDLSSNTNNLPATQNAEVLLGSLKMDIKIESAQADLSDQTTDLSDNTNYLQATRKKEVTLESSKTEMSIESAQVDLGMRNVAHDLSDNTNTDIQGTLNTDDYLQSEKVNLSIETSQVDIILSNVKTETPSPLNKTADSAIQTKTDEKNEPGQRNISSPDDDINNSTVLSGPLGSLQMDIKIESAQADSSDQAPDLSDNTNYLQATRKKEVPLESSKTEMSIESAQVDLGMRNVAHDLSDNTNTDIQGTLNTDDYLQSENVNLGIETSQVDIILSNVKTETPSPLNKPADSAIQTKTDEKNEPGQRNIRPPDDDINNSTDKTETLLDAGVYLQSTEIDSRKSSFCDKETVNNNTCNTIKVSKNTETSIETTQTDIITVGHGISNTTNSKKVPLSIKAYLERKTINISSNKTKSDISVNNSTQQNRKNIYSTEVPIEASSIKTNPANNMINTDKDILLPNSKVHTKFNINKNNKEQDAVKMIINQKVESKVTVEVVNRISIQTDVLKAIIDNVQRISEVQDKNITPMITVASIDETAENRASLGHNTQKSMSMDKKDNDEKLQAARERLARVSAMQTEFKDNLFNDHVVTKKEATNGIYDIKISKGPNGEYIPQVITLPHDGSIEQTDYNTNKSKGSGQIHHENQTKLKTNNLHNTEDNNSNSNYYDSEKALSRKKIGFERNREIDEVVQDTPERSKKRYKDDEDNKEEPNDNLYSRRTLDINMTDIQQAIAIILGQTTAPDTNNLREESNIDETLFFIFQIQFFRRVQERLRDNKRKKLAKKLEKTISKLIAISDNEGAKADLKYKCHKCLEKAIYSPRQLYYKVDRQYLDKINKTIQNCEICKLFMTKYIEVLKIYVVTCNGNPEAETKRNNDGQMDSSIVSINECQTRRLETQHNLSFNSINEYICVDTDPGSPFCNQEKNTVYNYDPIEEQLSIISGVHPATLDDQEEVKTVNILDVSGKTQTDNNTNNVVTVPYTKVKESVIGPLIIGEEIESAENKVAVIEPSLNATSNNNNDNDKTERDHELRKCNVNVSDATEKTKNPEPSISKSDSHINNNDKERQLGILKSCIIETAGTIISEQCNRDINTSIDNNDKQKNGEQVNGVATCTDSCPPKRKISGTASNDNVNKDSIKRRHVIMKSCSSEANIGTNVVMSNINSPSNDENANINNKYGRYTLKEIGTAFDAKINESTIANNNANHKNEGIVHGLIQVCSNETIHSHITNVNPAANNNSFNFKKYVCDVRQSISSETARSSIVDPHSGKYSIAANKGNEKGNQKKKSEKIKNMTIETIASSSTEPHNKDINAAAQLKNNSNSKKNECNKISKCDSTDTVARSTTARHKDANKDVKRDHSKEKNTSAKTASIMDDCSNKNSHRELRKSMSTKTARSMLTKPRNESTIIASNKNNYKDKKRENRNIETCDSSIGQSGLENTNKTNDKENKRDKMKTMSIETAANINLEPSKENGNTAPSSKNSLSKDAEPSTAPSNVNINKIVKDRCRVQRKIISAETIISANAEQCYKEVIIAQNNIPRTSALRELGKIVSAETARSAIAEPRNESLGIATNKVSNKEKKQENINKISIETATSPNAEPNNRIFKTKSNNNKEYKNTTDNQREIMKHVAAETVISKNAEFTSAANNNNKEKKRHDESRKRSSTETATSSIAQQCNINTNIITNEDNVKEKKLEKRKRLRIESNITTNAEPHTKEVNTAPNNNSSHSNKINIATNEDDVKQKKRKKRKRMSIESAISTNTELHAKALNTAPDNNNSQSNNINITTNKDSVKERKSRKRLSIESAITNNTEPPTKTVDIAPNYNSSHSNGINNGRNEDHVKEKKREKRRRLSFESAITTNAEPHINAVNTAPDNNCSHRTTIVNIASHEDNVKEKRREKRKRLSIDSDITTNAKPYTKAINTAPNDNSSHSNNINIPTNKNEKHEKKKRMSIDSANTTKVELYNRDKNTKSRNNNDSENNSESQQKIISAEKASNENAETCRNINTTPKNDNGHHKNKEDHGVRKIIKDKTATSKKYLVSNAAAKHDRININDQGRHSEVRKSTSTEIATNTIEEPRKKNSGNSDNKPYKKRDKRHTAESNTTTTVVSHNGNINTTSHNNNTNENNSAKHREMRKSSTDENASNENVGVRGNTNTTSNNGKDNRKYKERDHRSEIAKSANSKNAESNTTAKQDNINTKDKERQDKVRKSISAQIASNTIKGFEKKRINEDQNEKKREKRKRMTIESATTTNVEPDNRKNNSATHKNTAKENSRECNREKTKKNTAENANIHIERARSNENITANNTEENRKNKKVWALFSVESNTSGIGKILIRAQANNKGNHESNNTGSNTSTTAGQRNRNMESASNNNDEGKRRKNKNKEIDRESRSISRETIANTSSNKPGKDKISTSNKKSNIDNSRGIRENSKDTTSPPITSTTTINSVNTDINCYNSNTSANPIDATADFGKHKETEANGKNNEIQTNEDSDSNESDSDTDEDSKTEESEASDNEANQTTNKALDKASRLLNDKCISEDLPAVKISGKSTSKKDSKHRIKDTPYLYECPTCTCMFTYLRSLFSHILQQHKFINTEAMNYKVLRKCAFCGLPIEITRNKYTNHVRKYHPSIFTQIQQIQETN